jgi:hypothetical protein
MMVKWLVWEKYDKPRKKQREGIKKTEVLTSVNYFRDNTYATILSGEVGGSFFFRLKLPQVSFAISRLR